MTFSQAQKQTFARRKPAGEGGAEIGGLLSLFGLGVRLQQDDSAVDRERLKLDV